MMKKNIVYWIKKLKEGSWKASKKNADPEMDKHEKSDINIPDYIRLLDNTVKDINTFTNNLVQTTHLSPDQYELHVHIHDNALYMAFVNQGFEAFLQKRIMMENNYSFARYRLQEGICEGASAIGNSGVSIRLLAVETGNKHATQATIEVAEGYGSLVDGPVEMTAEYCQTHQGYNIGVGRNPRLDNGLLRTNEIAIDDNPQSPAFEQNKYVSRSHARITYEENHFKLYVERGGTRAAGKTTLIVRNGKEMLLNHAGVGWSLQNGDQIVLNRKVILLFREQNN